MHKIVNGIEVECTPEEAATIQAEWDANAPTLDLIKSQKSAFLNAQAISLVESRYPSTVQAGFAGLLAASLGKPNRAAYCQQLLTWAGMVVGAYAAAASQVQAAEDQAGVDAVALDIAALLDADPKVTLMGAFAIAD